MGIVINNASFKLRNSTFIGTAPVTPIGQIFRIANTFGVDSSFTYINISGSIAYVPNIESGSVAYVLTKSGSQIELQGDNDVQRFTITNLLITSSVEQTLTFTEQIISTVGAGNWTKPVGVTQVIVECWGAGGAGGGATLVDTAGGGGGGGQYSRKLLIYPSAGSSIPYSVGAGAVGTIGNGASGGDTTWNTNQVVAKGGTGGQADGSSGTPANGGSGDVAGSVGDVIRFGGLGGSGTVGRGGVTAEDGGSGAGSAADGTAGFAFGTNVFEYGGTGGERVTGADSAGFPGELFGAGGSGAVSISGANFSGGNGAQGLIRLIYR